MANKITMQQIADRLGVSKYTVSQALAGKPGVSETTRKEVAALAGALGYGVRREAGSGGAEDSGRGNLATQRIASPALAGDLNPAVERAGEQRVLIGLDERHAKEPNFWKRVVEGMEAGCRLYGLNPAFFAFGQEAGKQTELQALLGRAIHGEASGEADITTGVAGFIVAGNCPLTTLLQIRQFGLPIVLADHDEPLIGADAVLNANSEAGRMGCRHLLSRDCRSIAFVGRDSFAVSFRERWWGCRQAIDEAREVSRSAIRTEAEFELRAEGTRTYARSDERKERRTEAGSGLRAEETRTYARTDEGSEMRAEAGPGQRAEETRTYARTGEGSEMRADAGAGQRAAETEANALPEMLSEKLSHASYSVAAQLKKWTIPYGGSFERTWQSALERRISAAAAEGALPDGFLCANDDIALHLLQLLEGRGLRASVRVVGIDNTAAGMEAAVPLTTVDLAKEWLGIRAVEAFARKLAQPGTPPERIVLSTRLIVRHSG